MSYVQHQEILCMEIQIDFIYFPSGDINEYYL